MTALIESTAEKQREEDDFVLLVEVGEADKEFGKIEEEEREEEEEEEEEEKKN